MIHGRDRSSVQEKISELRRAAGIGELPHCVLFSRRRFKQRGARYDASPIAESVRAHG
jgi:hypothetical protein